jgi:tetratricopeptide (TPR) repeat protein
MFLYAARRYDEAIEQCQRVIELNTDFPTINDWLGKAYEQKGLNDQAIEAYLKDFDPKTATSLRTAYAISGWSGYWQKELEYFKEVRKHHYLQPGLFAVRYAKLGEKDQAFAWLEKAVYDRHPLLCMLKTLPDFDGLRSDPRFTDLLRRIGFKL